MASVITSVLVLKVRWGRWSVVDAINDPQHIHEGIVPRAGGLALGVAALAGAAMAHGSLTGSFGLVSAVLVSAVPILAVGLAEDIAGRVTPRWRYLASLLSAGLAFHFAEAHLVRLDVEIFDAALSWKPFMAVATIFCVAGVTQSFNIIDGKNGLSAGIALIALTLMVATAAESSDRGLATVSAIGAGGALGFLILNFPRGLIFLGDGGAYFLGFLVAVMAVLLVQRHDHVSAWYPLLLAPYPILETLVSFGRRLLVERQSFHSPDHLHLHSLLYRVLYLKLRRPRRWPLWQINALAALPILIASGLIGLLAHQWRFDAELLQMLASGSVAVYLLAYLSLRIARARSLRRR